MSNRDLLSIANPAWFADGLCTKLAVDPDAFHPEKVSESDEALSVCGWCPVEAQCLAYALAHNLRGIWGGTTDKQRRAIARNVELPLRPCAKADCTDTIPLTAPGQRRYCTAHSVWTHQKAAS